VNEFARGTMATREYAKFPTGSVLVREKLLTPEASKPEVLVSMIKCKPGFNRKANDWEFMTVSGDLRRIEAREKQGKCQKCHKSQAWHDYVWRYPVPGVR
jgi:Cytochrome P460